MRESLAHWLVSNRVSDVFGSAGTGTAVANLVASSYADNQFLLIAAIRGTPGAAFDAEHDPVIMAVSFERSSLTGHRLATVLVPGEELYLCFQCQTLHGKVSASELFLFEGAIGSQGVC